MKILTTKRYNELLEDSHENTAREATITNLYEEIRKKDAYIKKLKDELRRKTKTEGE